MVPEKIALPDHAGRVPAVDFLAVDQLRDYLDVESMTHDNWEELPKPCHKVTRNAEDRLASELLSRDMAVLMPECELPQDRSWRPIVGGFFCLKKVGGK